ncbi:unnamed protein product [Lymnaea stagnalis]|uniref:Pyridoxal phosphate phosphatase PHOSPHO2 n=1 Tax=Lymnaea stagnalis TaxID=6523 RepID=A0AAV2I0D3_LYMST
MSSYIRNNEMSSIKKERLLMVFDFDHSLVDENSDTYVTKLAPGGELPEEIKSLYAEDGWTDYMAEIFKYLHKNGRTPNEILECISQIPLTKGMNDLLTYSQTIANVDHIIISDSNSVFIDHILGANNLSPTITKVFTNPAEFDDSGCLRLKHYHIQDWCTLSTINLCKGHILKSFLAERENEGAEYKHIIYVGDGHNDLCPGLVLRPQDIFMPRKGFALERLIEKIKRKNKPVKISEIKAKIVPWETGLDILQHIKCLEMAACTDIVD